jgi:hypothetical protein
VRVEDERHGRKNNGKQTATHYWKEKISIAIWNLYEIILEMKELLFQSELFKILEISDIPRSHRSAA